MEDLPNSSTCPTLLKNQISGERASPYMPLFGTRAVSERLAGERETVSGTLFFAARIPVEAFLVFGWGIADKS